MIKIEIIFLCIILHFVFNWILQKREIAKNKKENINALNIHIWTNVVPYILIIMFIVGGYYKANIENMFMFFIINVSTHFIIDSALPNGKNERNIINMTAIDQILHLLILFTSLNFLI